MLKEIKDNPNAQIDKYGNLPFLRTDDFLRQMLPLKYFRILKAHKEEIEALFNEPISYKNVVQHFEKVYTYFENLTPGLYNHYMNLGFNAILVNTKKQPYDKERFNECYNDAKIFYTKKNPNRLKYLDHLYIVLDLRSKNNTFENKNKDRKYLRPHYIYLDKDIENFFYDFIKYIWRCKDYPRCIKKMFEEALLIFVIFSTYSDMMRQDELTTLIFGPQPKIKDF